MTYRADGRFRANHGCPFPLDTDLDHDVAGRHLCPRYRDPGIAIICVQVRVLPLIEDISYDRRKSFFRSYQEENLHTSTRDKQNTISSDAERT